MVKGRVVDGQRDVKVSPEGVRRVARPRHQSMPSCHAQTGGEVRGAAG